MPRMTRASERASKPMVPTDPQSLSRESTSSWQVPTVSAPDTLLESTLTKGSRKKNWIYSEAKTPKQTRESRILTRGQTKIRLWREMVKPLPQTASVNTDLQSQINLQRAGLAS